MSIWAANLVAAAALLSGGQRALTAEEAAAWKRIRLSVVPIMQNGTVRSSGALIDANGLVIAHRSNLPGPPLYAKLADGNMVPLKEIAADPRTQMVLLQATGWTGGSPARVMPDSRASTALKLIAALPEGAIRAELVSNTRIGAIDQKMTKLSEIRFEAPSSLVAGAPVFNFDGELVGILGATLDSPASPSADLGSFPMARTGIAAKALNSMSFGPSAMTIAYSIAPDILQRVVSGFQTPLHVVLHPSLGIMVRESPSGNGVYVNSVEAAGSAYKGGVRGGDIIVSINGDPVRTRTDYARLILSQKVGSVITVEVKRIEETLSLKVNVGSK